MILHRLFGGMLDRSFTFILNMNMPGLSGGSPTAM
jgi:hypothetical protein